MRTLQALIFDVDGTLAETEELHRHAFNAAFKDAGLPWFWDEALYGKLLEVTGGKERIAHYQRDHLGTELLQPDQIAALHAAKTQLYTRSVSEGGLALRPGIKRLLEEAEREGVRRAIATTTSRANVDALLAACAPLPQFDVIAAGDEVKKKKPAPDIYKLALERLGMPADQCLAIEDTANGLASAAAAGLRCVMTISLYGGAGPYPEAALTVPEIGDGVTLARLDDLLTPEGARP